MGEPMVSQVVRMPAELHDRVRAKASAEDRSMAAVIRQALRAYVEDGEARELRPLESPAWPGSRA